jgi:arylsulfatase A-like enzyme/beta-glucanase (GH16 family)
MNLKTLFPFALTPLLWASASQAQERSTLPNVIVILADDLGYADVGFNGCKDIPTPNIDRIAQNGVRFTNGYVSFSVCGPSRAGLMTGRYQDRFGFSRNPLFAPNDPEMGLPQSEQTLADALNQASYRSLAIGKWHLGAHESLHPLKRGFNDFYGFLGGGHQYFPEELTLKDEFEVKTEYDSYRTMLLQNYRRVEEKEYLTDAFSREAVSYIEANKDAPFFIYLAYNAPHGPLQATEKYMKRFDHIENQKRRTYAAMVSAVDDGVGNVLDKLEELGISDNTMVFFLSDNGGPEEQNGSDNGILREGKSSLYEGGIRVPFAMQWPSRIAAGKVYDEPVIALDIFATAVGNAGVSPKNQLDGVDLVPYLTGKKQGAPHEALFWRKFDQNVYAVRQGDYKVVRYKSVEDEMYDVEKDISETNPLSTADQADYSVLKKAYAGWEDQMTDPAFLGLMQDKEYSLKYPNRFRRTNPYEPDTLKPVVPEGYSLLWSDEFDKPGKPDPLYWVYEEGFVRNQELQWYQPDNANVRNGVLEIEGRRERVQNPDYEKDSKNWKTNRREAEYTSACVKTSGKFSFQYGIMEVRAKIDTSMGMWPAIWTLGVTRRWPGNGEVDQMEYFRHEGIAKIFANAAWAGPDGKIVWDVERIPFDNFLDAQPDWAERFHIWKMDWTEDYIRLYMDGQLLNEIDIKNAEYLDGFNPFHQPQYILLNLAIGSNGGDPSGTTFPRKYLVDYVRVYQKN